MARINLMRKDPKKEREIKKGISSVGLKNEKRADNIQPEDLYLQKAFEEMEEALSFPSDEIFERICTRLANEEREGSVQENVRRAEGLGTGLLEWVRGLFRSPGLAWGLCGAQAIVLVLAILVLNKNKPRFETMSYGQETNHKQVFNVIFNRDVKFGDVVSFLKEHHMKIINGPMGKDLFVIEIGNKKDIEGLKKSDVLEFMAKAY